MSSIRDRLEQLKAKAKKPIKGDSELLRKIHPYLLRAGETEFTDPEEFVRKTKGSFSQMVDQKNGRVFSTKFYLPLEIVLNTSMAYLLEGRGEPAPLTNDRGLRYTAMTDTFGNYEKLVEEGVYLEQDEYQWTLLDYMLEFNAKNGLEFFSQRDELPLDDLGLWKGDYSTLNMYQHDQTDLLDAVLGLCEVNTAIKYLNGYHFVEAPLNHQDLSEEALVDVFHNVQFAMRREEVRRALCDYKIVPLKTANPHLLSAGGQPLGKTAFTNIFLPMMLQWAISGPFQVIEENGQIELFDKAFEINEAVMPIILSLPYSHYRVGDYGYVYSDGIVCGSIACVQLDFNPLGVFGDELAGKIARLNAQVQAFYERLNRSNQVSFLGREMQLAKVGSPVFYEFYRLMNKAGCSFVPRYEEEKSEYKDFFFLPEGKQIPLPANDQPTLYPQALRALAKIDGISEAHLGAGKIYFFPKINNRSFYAVGDWLTGIAPTEVVIGERYDNLAEFLAWTCLFSPSFQGSLNQVVAFATSLKEYGIKKKELDVVLESLISYFTRSLSRYDKKAEQDKALIANTYSRIHWIDLFADEIKKQFK